MPSMLERQRDFGARVLSGSASEGFAVYRSNAYGNWAKALACAYPIVRKIVGEAFFDGMARTYAHAYPSMSGDLNEYGAELAEFLSRFPPTQDLPYLPDVARMEWLAHQSFYAANTAAVDLDRLKRIGPEEWTGLRLALAPACALLASIWPLERIWTVHRDDYRGEIQVDLHAGPDRIAVYRLTWRVQVRSLAPGDYRFLECAQRGESLGTALEAAAAIDAAFDASVALAVWVDQGVITL
jgi:uncharacterized protein